MKLSNGNDVDLIAYELGYQSYLNDKSPNPYIENTDQWFSWNRGWNAA